MNEVNLLIDNYYNWLKDKTSWKNINNWIEITTPYLDRNNDYIQIYLQRIEEHYILTDGGDTINGLVQEGCTIDNSTPKRQKLLYTALNGYGVKEKEGRLELTADEKNFSLRKHSLLQAILAINDMFYLTRSTVANLFFEDIRDWLDQSNIRYSELVSFSGRSGYSRKFDFLIPKSLNAPERLIKTLNNPDKSHIDSIIMDWLDTQEVRAENSKAYVIANDNNKNVPGNMIEALKEYQIETIPWSQRNKSIDKLAA